MLFRLWITLAVFGLVGGRAANAQSFPAVPSPAPARESGGEESERLKRINEQIEIRRSGTQLRTRNALAADVAATRAELDRLTRLREGTAGFLAGRTDAADVVGVNGLLHQVGHVPSVVAALQTSVPELEPVDFVQEAWREVVERDGRLTPPPRFLRVVEGYRSLQDRWMETAEDLRQERPPSDETLLELEEAASELSVAARPAINNARGSDGREALAWLNRVECFLRDLDAAEIEQLGRFLRRGGHTFAGGTVGELLSFLTGERLNLQPGRPGQIALATAGAVILAEADADIAVLEDRIEFYKQQDGAGGATQPGRMIFRTGSGTSDAPALPRRDPAVPVSQPLASPGVNVAADMR